MTKSSSKGVKTHCGWLQSAVLPPLFLMALWLNLNLKGCLNRIFLSVMLVLILVFFAGIYFVLIHSRSGRSSYLLVHRLWLQMLSPVDHGTSQNTSSLHFCTVDKSSTMSSIFIQYCPIWGEQRRCAPLLRSPICKAVPIQNLSLYTHTESRHCCNRRKTVWLLFKVSYDGKVNLQLDGLQFSMTTETHFPPSMFEIMYSRGALDFDSLCSEGSFCCRTDFRLIGSSSLISSSESESNSTVTAALKLEVQELLKLLSTASTGKSLSFHI